MWFMCENGFVSDIITKNEIMKLYDYTYVKK